jgi:hypothetical protein
MSITIYFDSSASLQATVSWALQLGSPSQHKAAHLADILKPLSVQCQEPTDEIHLRLGHQCEANGLLLPISGSGYVQLQARWT